MIDLFNDKIKQLSNNDKKNISQIGLKLGSEYGELVSKLLPFDNADGTTHRFVDRDAITEEIADMFLVLASLKQRLNISDEKMEKWVIKKTHRWEKLQEITSLGEYPYELHVTVASAPSYDKFIQDCADIGVKAVVLDLHSKSNGIINDVMTSSTIKGDNRSVIDELDRITYELESRNYKVVRQKVETVPWHPSTLHERSDDNYFESHIPVTVIDGQTDELFYLCKLHPGSHLSRNSLKEFVNGSSIYMVTIRHKDLDLEKFKGRVDKLKDAIVEKGYEVGSKDIIEWAIYDNNIGHDDEWVA